MEDRRLNFLAAILYFIVLVQASLLHEATEEDRKCNVTARGKCSFPEGFVFGTASAAYQNEGAAAEGGRTPSIWDTFAHTQGKVTDGTNGDIAADQYHRYKEDVQYLKTMGMDAYRFSISWSRLCPDAVDKVNPEGFAFYNALIDELINNGIQPYVTVYHWDLPQALEDSMNGWLNSDIVPLFAKFAETCFAAFGDRVKHWVTLNEPDIQAILGYQVGMHPPGRCSPPLCASGNSSTEPYIVGHNLLLAHAAASDLYKNKFQAKQGGQIGLVILCFWYEPYTTADSEAAQLAMDFELGWFADPLFYGDYPSSMRKALKERLPYFTAEQSRSLMNSVDFLGINHYTTSYAEKASSTLGFVRIYVGENGSPIGAQEASGWFYEVPWGFRKLLNYIKQRYGNPPVFVLENGMEMFANQTINDARRIEFYQSYICNMLAAIRDGADVRGYFVWSFLDGWEWSRGFSFNFGLYYVDYANGLKRYPKQSAEWFARFLSNKDCVEHAES